MAMEQIEVKILDRTFKLQVPPNEKPRLMNAVRIVDQKMREIRDASLAHGVDLDDLLLCYYFLCHINVYYLLAFFLLATVFFLPLRVRALFLVL